MTFLFLSSSLCRSEGARRKEEFDFVHESCCGFTGTRRTGNSPLISDGFRAIRKETFVQRVVSWFSTCRCWCSASIKDGKARCDIVVCGLAYQSPTFLFFILSFSFFVFASTLFLLFPFFSLLFLRLKRI